MRQIPFTVIVAATQYDPDAIEDVLRHFERYIVYRAIVDPTGEKVGRSLVDLDLYDHAKGKLLLAIGKYQFQIPPPEFRL